MMNGHVTVSSPPAPSGGPPPGMPITNRLNVATTGLEAGSGTHYIPKWSEVAVTLSIIAAGFAIFRCIAGSFPVFEEEHHNQKLVDDSNHSEHEVWVR